LRQPEAGQPLAEMSLWLKPLADIFILFKFACALPFARGGAFSRREK